MIGSVGTLGIVGKDLENSYISNNIGVINDIDNYFKSEYLHLFLTSKFGKILFDKFEMRTAQPKISHTDICKMPIPILDIEKQYRISDLIQNSFELKNKSKKLLEIAKTMVEIAIEYGEDKAIKYYNAKNIEMKI